MNEAIKIEMIRYRVQRATETIDEVSSHILNNYLHTAANRIYYGIFYIVSALALKFDFQTKNHGQLMGWFNREFIKTKKFIKNFQKYIVGHLLIANQETTTILLNSLLVKLNFNLTKGKNLFKK